MPINSKENYNCKENLVITPSAGKSFVTYTDACLHSQHTTDLTVKVTVPDGAAYFILQNATASRPSPLLGGLAVLFRALCGRLRRPLLGPSPGEGPTILIHRTSSHTIGPGAVF